MTNALLFRIASSAPVRESELLDIVSRWRQTVTAAAAEQAEFSSLLLKGSAEKVPLLDPQLHKLLWA